MPGLRVRPPPCGLHPEGLGRSGGPATGMPPLRAANDDHGAICVLTGQKAYHVPIVTECDRATAGVPHVVRTIVHDRATASSSAGPAAAEPSSCRLTGQIFQKFEIPAALK